MPLRPVLPALSTCIVSLLLLTACGGGSGNPAASPTASPAPNPASPAAAAPAPAPSPAPAPPGAAAPAPAAPPSGQPAPPYLRILHVDGAHPAASDTGTGSAETPLRTISAALRRLQPGDDVVVAAGTYREALVVPELAWGGAHTRLRAAEPGTVVVKGSDEIGGFVAGAGGVLSVAWAGEEPQQVFQRGRALRQVGGTVFGGFPADPRHELANLHAGEGGIWPGRLAGAVAQLVPGSFTYDAASRRLHVRPEADPAGVPASFEVSTRRHVFQAEMAERFTLQGIVFEHSNTTATYRQGAVKMQGRDNVLEQLVVRAMDGACVQINGERNVLRTSRVEACGQLGVAGFGRALRIEGNVITRANLRGFNASWEAGGIKLVGNGGAPEAVIRDNVVTHNEGDGIWLDWKHEQVLIEANTAAYNAGFGIHYEASTRGTIRANRAYGNRLRGIYLLESSDSRVEDNAVFGNGAEGIAVVDGWRSAQDASLRPRGNRLTGNAVAWNDHQRNWVQLAVPGRGYATVSDRNDFKTQDLLPRMSLGFVGPGNPAYERLADWRQSTQLDLASTEELSPMPAALRTALADKRLIARDELPGFLAAPGVGRQ